MYHVLGIVCKTVTANSSPRFNPEILCYVLLVLVVLNKTSKI